MPNGRIIGILAVDLGNSNRHTHVIEINQKDWTFDSKIVSKKHFFFRGAVASSVGEVFASGSEIGRSKAAAMINLRGSSSSATEAFRNLPEMLFGRFNHSMIHFDYRYLYTFGGSYV
jgi:hypothetical protein